VFRFSFSIWRRIRSILLPHRCYVLPLHGDKSDFSLLHFSSEIPAAFLICRLLPVEKSSFSFSAAKSCFLAVSEGTIRDVALYCSRILDYTRLIPLLLLLLSFWVSFHNLFYPNRFCVNIYLLRLSQIRSLVFIPV